MPTATVNGLSIAYEITGDEGGQPWIITPGGRFTKETGGVPELAAALAEKGKRVVTWDRPNCGASDVCFDGPSESVMQADVLAGLLTELELGPAVIMGGSGGARVSMLAAVNHPKAAAGLAILWISGGTYGLMSLGMHYCSGSLEAAFHGTMEDVANLAEWQEVITKNPNNRQKILDQDREAFVKKMDQWMLAYCPCGEDLVPGLPEKAAKTLSVPALVFRSGAADIHHTRQTSENVAAMLPTAELVEPPWGDNEWHERQAERTAGHAAGLFVRWPLLIPQLMEWSDRTIG